MEGFVPPPVGAFAGGSAPRWHVGWGFGWWAGQRSRAQQSPFTVGDDEAIWGSGDGDAASAVEPVVIRAQQHEVVQLGSTAVFPVPDVMGVQTPGGPTAGNRARGMAVLECAAKPPVDQTCRSAGTDRLAVAFEPDFTGGITGQILAVSVGQQWTQM